MRSRRSLLVSILASAGCGGWGGGSKWVEQPLTEDERPASSLPPGDGENGPRARAQRPGARTLGGSTTADPSERAPELAGQAGGRVVGTFRNTYYDFPREADHSGKTAPLMNAACQPIAQVPRSFFEAVCVQGSGTLTRGTTVSFAKRECACAEVCPRTGQRICFDALDATRFPWGRGATGGPITPMRTLAADTAVLAMGTVVYIPELDGVPRGESTDVLDGCFVVEDRGLRVKGEHVDIFTGHPSHTAVLNRLVPSNQGVTIVVESPRCAHLPGTKPAPK